MVALEDVKGLKVQELKDELKALGLDTKGVKAELVKRLEEALAAKEVTQDVLDAPAIAATGTSAIKTSPAGGGDETIANGRAPIHFKATAAGDAPKKADGAEKPATAPAAASGTLSEVEKRKQRAERFGVEPSAADKAKLRAERFGLKSTEEGSAKAASDNGVQTTKASHIVAKELTEGEKQEDLEKKKARAKRFNLPVPSSKEEEAAKKKARLDRFGTANGSDSKAGATDDELAARIAARAERFGGTQTTAPLTKSELDAKKEARAIRFAAVK